MNATVLDLTGCDNPFVRHLDACLSDNDLAERLTYFPLQGLDLGVLSTQARMNILDRMQLEMFEPTTTSLQIATSLFRLIRRGYLPRNPEHPDVRRKTMAVASFSGQELSKLPWFPTYALGMRVAGETGTGKSYEISRALNLLPSGFVQERNEKAGWTHLVQVVWLYVPMSHDGSLGGLLLNILCAMDAVAGTEYASTKSLIRLSNEKLAVRIAAILLTHGVGVLVIDELQSRNFTGGKHGGLAATFFLRLLNFGIPVVLVGNPFGMEALDRFSQDMRRLSAGGSFDMKPMAESDFDWEACLRPALLRYNVMPQPGIADDEAGASLFTYSGGIRDYACRIRVESQRLALGLGSEQVSLAHMKAAFEGPAFSHKDRQLIAVFRDRNPILLQEWEDIRWEMYARDWGYFNRSQAPSSDATGENDCSQGVGQAQDGAACETGKTASQRDQISMKQKRTRKANELRKQEEIRANLKSQDMRSDGMKEYLIAGFEMLRPQS
ncbi:MAG TPA: ATP-binding protein [Rhodocyclaceae bacterium]|nr:ATP-binding protein [Rhodocyclaceae bacterium]